MTLTALVTLDDVADHLNLTDLTNAGELAGFIDAATAFVEFQTGPIIPREVTEVHNGGGVRIILDNPPVLSVTSVTEYVGPTGYALTQTELGTTAGSYSFSLDDPQRGIITRRYNGGLAGPFMGGISNIKIVYTAGRDAVPADIRMAVLEDLRGLWAQTQRGNSSGRPVPGGDTWTESPMNPIGTFPRLAALLAGPSRTPSIA